MYRIILRRTEKGEKNQGTGKPTWLASEMAYPEHDNGSVGGTGCARDEEDFP